MQYISLLVQVNKKSLNYRTYSTTLKDKKSAIG